MPLRGLLSPAPRLTAKSNTPLQGTAPGRSLGAFRQDTPCPLRRRVLCAKACVWARVPADGPQPGEPGLPLGRHSGAAAGLLSAHPTPLSFHSLDVSAWTVGACQGRKSGTQPQTYRQSATSPDKAVAAGDCWGCPVNPKA